MGTIGECSLEAPKTWLIFIILVGFRSFIVSLAGNAQLRIMIGQPGLFFELRRPEVGFGKRLLLQQLAYVLFCWKRLEFWGWLGTLVAVGRRVDSWCSLVLHGFWLLVENDWFVPVESVLKVLAKVLFCEWLRSLELLSPIRGISPIALGIAICKGILRLCLRCCRHSIERLEWLPDGLHDSRLCLHLSIHVTRLERILLNLQLGHFCRFLLHQDILQHLPYKIWFILYHLSHDHSLQIVISVSLEQCSS